MDQITERKNTEGKDIKTQFPEDSATKPELQHLSRMDRPDRIDVDKIDQR